MVKRNKSAKVNLRFEPELKEAAEKAAAADMRSLTSLIEVLLTEHLRERGFLPEMEKSPLKRRTSASAEMAAS
jgi:hypothetical protein